MRPLLKSKDNSITIRLIVGPCSPQREMVPKCLANVRRKVTYSFVDNKQMLGAYYMYRLHSRGWTNTRQLGFDSVEKMPWDEKPRGRCSGKTHSVDGAGKREKL